MDISALTFDQADDRALYRQLCDALAGMIARGELQTGARLPSERDLAAQLGVSRTTAVSAYRELEARGLVRGHVGRGTFVCAGPGAGESAFAWRGKVSVAAQHTLDPALRTLVRNAAPDAISFAPGVTALDCFPAAVFRELTDAVLRRGQAALALGPTEGQPALRRALAGRAGVRPEQVLVLAGAQQGLDLVARCLLDPGDTVVMDRPGYLGALQTFRAAGARVVGWSIEDDALDELEDVILRYRPKFLYTTPTLQNPTGYVMPLQVRRELLELAARYRLPIVADDPYHELAFSGGMPPLLRDLDDQGLVISVGTFSKSLAPGLRLGWLTAPEMVIDQLATIKARVDVFTPGLTQLVLADFLASRRYDEHLRALRAEHARRHGAMLAALARHLPRGTLAARPVAGGLYLWGRLGEGLAARELLHEATTAGVLFVEGEHFYPDGGGKHELRLCFSGVPPARIDEGIRRLAPLLAPDAPWRWARVDGRQPLI